MNALDTIDQLRALDTQDMYGNIWRLPEQMTDARKLAEKWPFDPAEFEGARNIVLAGMGGSAIGGDLVRSLWADSLAVPFVVCRNYRLPEFVDDETLVIVSSYSGNTEETLATLSDALSRKAMVVAATTGGRLAARAKEEGFPCLALPSGMQPRAAIGFATIPLLYLFEKLGFAREVDFAVSEMILTLKDRRKLFSSEVETDANPAKKIAAALHGRVPLIYGGPELTDAVAVRWRGQISENAKSVAFSNVFPEMNHNELVGWSKVAAAYADKLAVVLLRDEEDNPRVKFRMDRFRDTVTSLGAPMFEVASFGSGRLARQFSLVQFGDFVSYYLALQNGVDPTPVAAIEDLKAALARV